jgi:hypothetical protein
MPPAWIAAGSAMLVHDEGGAAASAPGSWASRTGLVRRAISARVSRPRPSGPGLRACPAAGQMPGKQ